MRQNLNWDDVRTFLALARNSKLGTAAKLLGINSTTLSRRIARLAGSSNATLFEMHSGEWLLTEAGEKLLTLAERAESAMLDIEEPQSDGNMSGLIRIAVSESFGIWFLSDRINQFHDLYPNIVVEIIAPSWYFSPLKREVDMAVLPKRPQRGQLTTRRLVDADMGLFASPAYLAAHAPITGLEDLADHRLVGFARDTLSKAQLDHWMKLLPRAVTHSRMSGISMQARAVANGAGVGLLPCFMAPDATQLERVLSEQTLPKQSFWLVVREDVRHSRRIEVFVQWLTKQIHENRRFFTATNEKANVRRD